MNQRTKRRDRAFCIDSSWVRINEVLCETVHVEKIRYNIYRFRFRDTFKSKLN